MSIKEQAEKIGKQGGIDWGGFHLEVIVKDYKNSYGKDRWLVSPVSGSGEMWVEQDPMI